MYEFNKEPHETLTDEELAKINEQSFLVNRMYGEVVKPVIELIQMGRIEEAKLRYCEVVSKDAIEPVKTMVKKK